MIDRLWRAAAGGRGTARLAHLRYGGLKMPCDLTEMLQRQFYFFGTYFLEEQFLIVGQRLPRKPKLFLMWKQTPASTVWPLWRASRTPSSMPSNRCRKIRQADCGKPRSLIVSTTSWSMVAVMTHSGQGIAPLRGNSGTNEGMNYICGETGEPGAERVQTICLDDFCRENRITHIELLSLTSRETSISC